MFWEKIWKYQNFFIWKFSFFCKIFYIFEWVCFVMASLRGSTNEHRDKCFYVRVGSLWTCMNHPWIWRQQKLKRSSGSTPTLVINVVHCLQGQRIVQILLSKSSVIWLSGGRWKTSKYYQFSAYKKKERKKERNWEVTKYKTTTCNSKQSTP